MEDYIEEVLESQYMEYEEDDLACELETDLEQDADIDSVCT